jgi:hypothetical protein
MEFFSFLETLFFISLAVTFVLIIMLVYHFKGRLVLLEQKTNTMFEILSSMIKEMKDIRESSSILTDKVQSIERVRNESINDESQSNPAFSPSMPFGGGAGGLFPPELFRLFQMGGPSSFQENEYEDGEDGEEDEHGEFKKIVVSDTELDSDDEDEDNVRVISVDIDNSIVPEISSLDELQEQDIVLDEDIDVSREVVDEVDNDEVDIEDEADGQVDEEPEKSNEDTEQVDYRKLDVSYLRTMVLTRGLATDTKKLKKSDLIRLLEN